MGKIIKLTETQLKNIISKIINEQPTAPKQGPTVGGINVGGKTSGGFTPEVKPNLSCVAPEDYKIKGASANSFKYTKPDGEYIFYSDGNVWLYQLNTTKRIKTGKWVCGSNNIEVRWDNDPKSVNYQPLPKSYFSKKLDTTKCAKTIPEIFNGKFLFMGCSGQAVTDIQNMINTKSVEYGLNKKINADGTFGNNTRSVLQLLQGKFGVKDDGVVGGDTLSFLQKAKANTPIV